MREQFSTVIEEMEIRSRNQLKFGKTFFPTCNQKIGGIAGKGNVRECNKQYMFNVSLLFLNIRKLPSLN